MLRTALIAALPLAFGGVACAGPDGLPPPIEPAGRGMVQCYAPDLAKRTCQSMAAYHATKNGGVENVAEVLIMPTPPLIITVTSEATIRDGQVCGYVRGADLDKASFTLDGAGVTPEMAARFHTGARALYGSTLEREVCTAYVPDGDGFKTRITVDGAPQAAAVLRVIWVSPADGWRVGR